MLDDDLTRLNTQAADHSLDALESDIWAGLALRVRHRAIARRRAFLQGAVTALSLIVSIAIGIYAARTSVASGQSVVSSGLELAPSSLLLSDAR